MSYEVKLYSLLGPLLQGRLYPDVPPEPVTYPCAIYQQVGGQSVWFNEGSIPEQKHARVQLTVWADTRAQANTLIREIEDQVCGGLPKSESFGAAIAVHEPAIRKYGARLEFGLWYANP
ncbi:TPA: DUF3168 domain-containing protein [Stenotrophomonas maltophilia]|uniref:tail completion protein gp17 n=1 Tax=Stenotrophomonas maltophilia TaxID=40324 RepID=UPI0015DDCA26|nr:DUF3168 domain-containing protein [Stenotrophomonas maltophilia]MBA0448768.1 DUF3168 domain-containing protein [Stenotrophomonas maltophilia]HEL2980097.1 DUF3168 domain-containing protein [Stenotrophomonas maltophilia]